MEATKVRLKKPMPVADFSDALIWRFVILPPGDYLVVKVLNPTGMGVHWLVESGTKRGAAEVVWEEYLKNGKEKSDDFVSNDDAKRAG